MKKGLFFVIWMALLTVPLSAQTIEVSGEYQGDVLWDADTVSLMGDVVIEPDEMGTARLTVERGTCVIAEGYYRITVHNGSFYALGADKDPVTFTARDTADFYNPTAETGWHGIHLISDQSNAQDTVFMEFCEVKYGKIITGAPEGERYGAGVEVRNKKYCYFAHCRFSQNRSEHNGNSPTTGGGGGGMYVLNPGTILVEHCIFHDNYAWWGASVTMGGLRHFTVRNCEFYNNSGHYGTALDMHVGELSLSAPGPQVYNNYIHGNHGSTAYLGWEGVGRFHDNIIVNNDGYSPVLGTTAPNYSHWALRHPIIPIIITTRLPTTEAKDISMAMGRGFGRMGSRRSTTTSFGVTQAFGSSAWTRRIPTRPFSTTATARFQVPEMSLAILNFSTQLQV